jgi:hypothetical protein
MGVNVGGNVVLVKDVQSIGYGSFEQLIRDAVRQFAFPFAADVSVSSPVVWATPEPGNVSQGRLLRHEESEDVKKSLQPLLPTALDGPCHLGISVTQEAVIVSLAKSSGEVGSTAPSDGTEVGSDTPGSNGSSIKWIAVDLPAAIVCGAPSSTQLAAKVASFDLTGRHEKDLTR